MNIDVPVDLLGKPIQVGCWIAYPGQYAHVAVMSVFVVNDIVSVTDWRGRTIVKLKVTPIASSSCRGLQGKPLTLEFPERAVVLEQPK